MDIFFATSVDGDDHALPIMVAILQPDEREIDFSDVISSSLATYTALNHQVGFALIKGLSLGTGELVHAQISKFMAEFKCVRGRITVDPAHDAELVGANLLTTWANDICETPHSMVHFRINEQGFVGCERCYSGLIPSQYQKPAQLQFV